MRDGKYVILVVDDDQDILESLRVVLEANNYEVVTAESAEDGLRAYKTAQADLLIIDLMMEEIDAGVHLVKELRVLGNTAPVYVLSSVGDNLHAVTDFSSLGLSGVFQKPINTEMLLMLLKARLK